MHDLQTLFLTCDDPEIKRQLPQLFPKAELIEFDGLLKFTERQRHQTLYCFIDWLLPDISGLELCRKIRENPSWRHAHVTMVVEENDTDARRRALRAGADDYLSGPLTIEKLVERLGSGNLEKPENTANSLSHGGLEIDSAAFLVRYRGKRLGLPPNEFRLLAHFVQNPDRVFSRNSLIAMVGKDNEAIDDRTVDVWIGRLRRTLKQNGVPDPIRSVRSVGYVFDGVDAGLQ